MQNQAYNNFQIQNSMSNMKGFIWQDSFEVIINTCIDLSSLLFKEWFDFRVEVPFHKVKYMVSYIKSFQLK